MKKWVKVTLAIAGSLLTIVVLALVVVCTVIFTPEYITPIVKGQLDKNLPFKVDFSRADLVFFRSFPNFSVRISDIRVGDSDSGDCAAGLSEVFVDIDLMAFLRRNEIVLEELSISDGKVDVDALLTLMSEGEEVKGVEEEVEEELKEEVKEELETGSGIGELKEMVPFDIVDIRKVKASNLTILYGVDSSMRAELEGVSLDLKLKMEREAVCGLIDFKSESSRVVFDSVLWYESLPVAVMLPFRLALDSLELGLDRASISAGECTLNVDGSVKVDNALRFDTDLSLSVSDCKTTDVRKILPPSLLPLFDEYSPEGLLNVTLELKGDLAEEMLPSVACELSYDGNLWKSEPVSLAIKADSPDLNKINYDLSLSADLSLAKFREFLPDNISISERSRMSCDIASCGSLGSLEHFDADGIRAKGRVALSDCKAVYCDTLFFDTKALSLDFDLNERLALSVDFPDLDVTVGTGLYAVLTDADVAVDMANPLSESPVDLKCRFSFGGLDAQYNDISAAVHRPSGALAYKEQKDGCSTIRCDYKSNELYFSQDTSMVVETGNISIGLFSRRDTSATTLLAEWNPEVDVDFKEGNLFFSSMDERVSIPDIRFTYLNDSLYLDESRVVIGQSDFALRGVVTAISDYLDDKGLLTADLSFVSDNADVDELLELVSGFGANDGADEGIGNEAGNGENEMAAQVAGGEISEESEVSGDIEEDDSEPFIVPMGVDVNLHTDIKRAHALGQDIENVRGGITVKDGVAVVRQLGFTSDAARMQMTAMYKSPRKNHLFVGLDFHLMEIQIDKLIDMIPAIDSVVPMLKSFSGEAEFHLALQTNLDSKYQPKKSTLLGAASIEGKDLVVLDSETFDTIASMLLFSKKTVNKIDSLEVDVTLFRDEVDIYPFLIGMDNYQVILSGRHNLDMSFNYHLDCLSPVRLGLDVKGSLDNLKFALTPTKYKNLFKPERRNDIQERTLKLMEMINSSLKETVVEQERPE